MTENYKIGIICLANGPYAIFIDGLIESCETKFLPNNRKEYFIITDGEFNHSKDDNCTVIHKERHGWPMDCLIRHQYAYELKDITEHLDYVYFFNANMFINSEIGEEILPDESGLIGIEHPNFTHDNNQIYEYDRNPNSNAFVPMGEGKKYYRACLWGGTTKAFMELSEATSKWTTEDLNKGIQPVWFDESYLNKYFFIHPPKMLSPLYAYPLGWRNDYSQRDGIKIIQLQKSNYFSHDSRYVK